MNEPQEGPRTPREAARQYLEHVNVAELLADVLAVHETLRVTGKDQVKLYDGAQQRFDLALQSALDTVPNTFDTFARAQVLVSALRDFPARLRERGLIPE